MRTLSLLPLLAACSAPFSDAPGRAPQARDGAAEGATVRLVLGSPRATFAGGDGEPAPPGCADETDGGVRGSAVAKSAGVRLRSLVLLGAPGTPDVVLVKDTDFADAEEVELTSEGVEVRAGAIPAGDYAGIALALWTIRLDVPVSLPGLADEAQALTTWFAPVGAITPRDVTVDVEGVPHWIDVEHATLVSTVDAAVDTGGAADGDKGGDTGLAPADAGPVERLRTFEDPAFWDEDPVVISSDDGDMPFEIEGGAETLTLSGAGEGELEGAENAVLTLTFMPVDTMTWWEGPAGKAAVADGVYDPTEDCGVRMDLPGVVAGATSGGELPEVPDTPQAWDTGPAGDTGLAPGP